MEDLVGFFFVFGAAIIVTIVVITDFSKKKKNSRPHWKWGLIAMLSLWQVGCWRALSSFDSAFGNSTDLKWYEIGFIALVCIWIASQFAKYNKSKKSEQ